jgi:pyridoxal phosphate enzyme (YggS family)
MVVTKSHSLAVVKAAIAAGARVLGENYVEEAISKMMGIESSDVEWHMIGHIQSRKAKQVCEYFSWVHSVDRKKIADRLNNFAIQKNLNLKILLECNVSGEGSKFGYPVWKEEQWPDFVNEICYLNELPNLDIRGMMTMPPWDPDPEASRPYYQHLVRLRDYVVERFPKLDLHELSIGMSNDFEVAIQEGATMIRVGTAILGQRT